VDFRSLRESIFGVCSDAGNPGTVARGVFSAHSNLAVFGAGEVAGGSTTGGLGSIS
jgi:hypothetical protein